MNKKLLVGIAGVAIVLVGGAAMFVTGGASAKTGKYEYETVAVAKGDVARVISASGAVQPRERVDVGSEVSGKIVSVAVDFNDRVTKGQVLAQVDPETFQNTLDQQRARLRQSEASVANNYASIDRAKVALEVAEKNYNRQKALYAEQAIAQSTWEQAEQTYKNAQLSLQSEEVSLKSSLAGLETAKATVQDAVTKLERTKIRSPLDGMIVNRKVEVGQTVQSSQQVATLFVVAADLSEIEIEAAVVESDIGGIDPGDPVTFTVDAFPGDRFQGSVVQVRKLGAEQANVVTYTVVVNARNPGGKLYPGMTANVEITADRVSDVLRIAYDATKFQPPKDVQEALRAKRGGGPGGPGGGQGGPGGGFGGQGGGQGGQGGFNMANMTPEQRQQMEAAMRNGGGQGGQRGEGQRGGQGGQGGGGRGGPGGGFGGPGGGQQQQFTDMLKTAGVDDARIQKIMAEMQTEMEKVRASIPMPTQQQQGGVLGGGGGNFGPPPQMMQQQAMQEMRAKMTQAQETVYRRNLNETEYAAFSKAQAEMRNHKRLMVYRIDDKGDLEPHQLTIGLSDGSNVQIVSGAKEGDKFVVRAKAAGQGEQKKP